MTLRNPCKETESTSSLGYCREPHGISASTKERHLQDIQQELPLISREGLGAIVYKDESTQSKDGSAA